MIKKTEGESTFNAAAYFIDRHVGEGRGKKVAIEFGDIKVTYSELAKAVNRFGNGLSKLGVGKGDRVLLLLLDTPEFIISFFGAMKVGAVPVPLNTLLSPSDYEYVLNDSQAKALIVAEPLLAKIRPIFRQFIPDLKHIVVAGNSAHGEILFGDLILQNAPEADPATMDGKDCGFWLYTSGSTGAPKACVHRGRDMAITAEHYGNMALGTTAEDRFFSVSKLFFSYGLGNSLYLPLAVGGTVILMPGAPKSDAILHTIEKYRPTIFFSVPSSYAAMLGYAPKAGTKDFDLSSVRMAVSAGEPLPLAIFRKFKERFRVEILDHIGSTEGFAFITNRPGRARPGSSGEVVPGYQARIIGENGITVKTGETGNLLVKTGAMFANYWKQPEKTKDAVLDGWLRTGDRCYRDSDKYFWYVGRSDDMMKCNGAWVSPLEVERTLGGHHAVLESAVVGRKDRDDLLKPMAYVVLKEGIVGTPDLAREINEFLKERLPAYKRPHWLEFAADLPKTATGKIQRFKLRALNT